MRVLLALAVLPALVLMLYVYKKDTIEKEPLGLLLLMVAAGALACIPASFMEKLLLAVLNRFTALSPLTFSAVEAFLIVAFSEEVCKLILLKKLSWNSPAFNYRFDGIVYAVFLGLGFAAWENILYLFRFGPGVLVSRGLLAIPGHMTFAVFMGLHYANAKLCERSGDRELSRSYLRRALVLPMLLHGFYDFCLMSNLQILSIVFFAFVLLLDVFAIKTVKHQSKGDRPI